MKPSKQFSLDNQDQQQDFGDISDIAEIFQKLNNCNKSNPIKPYSEYDPESIFPPPSLVSNNNNEVESDRSKSNCFGSLFKRGGVAESKDQQEVGFGAKFEIRQKKVKRIEVEKVSVGQKGVNKDDVMSNKDSLPNQKQIIPLEGPTTNFRITDFLLNKKIDFSRPTIPPTQLKFQSPKPKRRNNSEQKVEKVEKVANATLSPSLEQQRASHIISSLTEKNNKRRKTIQELKAELEMLKARKQSTALQLQEQKEQQKQLLKKQLFQTGKHKFRYQKYRFQLTHFISSNNVDETLLPEVSSKLAMLEEYKKKSTSRKGKKEIHTDEESIGNNPGNPLSGSQVGQIGNLPEKKKYIDQWMAKLQKFRDKLREDCHYYETIFSRSKTLQSVEPQIVHAFEASLKDYLLYSSFKPYATSKNNLQEVIEINSFNIQCLRPEILTLLKFPKLTTTSSKHRIQKQLQTQFKLSKKLHNSSNCYFLQTTVAASLGQNNEFITFGRQDLQDYENLTEALHKYDSFSQIMIRYLARVCLIAIQQIKVKVNVPALILPANIYFTSKYDIKFSNILMNTLFLNQQFKQYLKQQSFYYYVAPQALSTRDYSNLSLWSLGILLYFIIYEKFPFQYEFEASFQKETFFIYNELIFPSKPVINEKLKDLITICLTGKQKDLTQLQKHPFFQK